MNIIPLPIDLDIISSHTLNVWGCNETNHSTVGDYLPKTLPEDFYTYSITHPSMICNGCIIRTSLIKWYPIDKSLLIKLISCISNNKFLDPYVGLRGFDNCVLLSRLNETSNQYLKLPSSLCDSDLNL